MATLKTTSLKQTIHFNATPQEIYQALTDAKAHAALTGGAATMKPVAGTSFSAYDGYITGKNLQLKEDKKIVQAWRAAEDHWPNNHFSKVTIVLKAEKSGTDLIFTQTGIPEEYADSIAEGWVEYYWNPLKRMLER